MPSGITLRELHDVIQAAFGWEDCHLWAFECGRDRCGAADRDLGIGNATSKQLRQVAAHPGDRLRNAQDFGDDREHDILIEDITEPEPHTAYPRCLTGRRARPPEDCGGMWGYDYLIEHRPPRDQCGAALVRDDRTHTTCARAHGLRGPCTKCVRSGRVVWLSRSSLHQTRSGSWFMCSAGPWHRPPHPGRSVPTGSAA
ncbi:plasmid pRiA4b ORF-3 family protein [Streptomyces sp. NPDC126510]|uniref:plasmid pRiA4b ORF-3 family protein n=1 Tax=Streptomyces sp. NPDC126510 TaxID=3155317 RepID=UPI0033254CF8